MTKRNATHSTFVIERTYPVPTEKFFKAFADPKLKPRWFHGPDGWGPDTFTSDFRVGGRESNRGATPDGIVHAFDSIYQDIVPNELIIFSYEMHLNGQKISVSLTTVEMEPEGNGTKLTFTEQGVFLDDYDDVGSREEGTQGLLENLGKVLAS